MFQELWRRLIFFSGDVRALHAFPYVTWSVHHHQIDYDEVMDVLPLIQYGDVGVHRDWGYLSNVGIPGFMKHAWLHVQDGVTRAAIVEAISEGVVQRNAMYAMFSDYSMLLSPKDVSDEERKGACKKVQGIVGAHYDAAFKFNIEEELKFYAGKEQDDAVKQLDEGQQYIRKYDYSFSCTEAVSYAWWHKREDLRLYRQEVRGRSVILADHFINRGWDIKWMSKSVTTDIAKKYGLGEEGLSMMEEYRARDAS